jgi:phage/plasmid-like protein (TIGR03299 family)
MAHNLTIVDGRAEMAYVGELPWHGLGQELKKGAPMKEWVVAAGMDWQVQFAPVGYKFKKGMVFEPSRVVMHRSDSGSFLGLASQRYKVVQPAEVLAFFEDLVASGGFHLSTAGTLHGGRKLWAMAEVSQDAVVKGDLTKSNLLLATACDGSMPTIGKLVNTRVVCENTLRMAYGEHSEDIVKVRHDQVFDAKKVQTQLGVAQGAAAQFIKDMRALAKRKVSSDEAEEITGQFVLDANMATVPEDTTDRAQAALTTKAGESIMRLFLGEAKGADLAGRTGWGWLNAVTEHVDHHAKAQSPSHRLDRAWFGTGDAVKVAARDRAMALLG